MSNAEKELVFSKTMCSTLEGKTVRDIIGEFLSSSKKTITEKTRKSAPVNSVKELYQISEDVQADDAGEQTLSLY